jgi:hypothetical protein
VGRQSARDASPPAMGLLGLEPATYGLKRQLRPEPEKPGIPEEYWHSTHCSPVCNSLRPRATFAHNAVSIGKRWQSTGCGLREMSAFRGVKSSGVPLLQLRRTVPQVIRRTLDCCVRVGHRLGSTYDYRCRVAPPLRDCSF